MTTTNLISDDLLPGLKEKLPRAERTIEKAIPHGDCRALEGDQNRLLKRTTTQHKVDTYNVQQTKSSKLERTFNVKLWLIFNHLLRDHVTRGD